MEHFAKSPFWRALAVALVAAIGYLGWAISGERAVLPVAHAGGVSALPGAPGLLCTTNEAGTSLYIWGLDAGYVDHYAFEAGTVTRRAFQRLAQPGQMPPPPGGTPGGRIEGR